MADEMQNSAAFFLLELLPRIKWEGDNRVRISTSSMEGREFKKRRNVLI